MSDRARWEGWEPIALLICAALLVHAGVLLVRLHRESERADRAEAEVLKLERQIDDRYISDWIKEAKQNAKIMEDSKKAARHGKK